MEVAALAFKAIANAQPNPNWEPAVGRLFVRTHLDVYGIEIDFCVADRERHHQSFARIRNWRGEPYFGGWTDGIRGEMGHTGSGAAISRRYAVKDDLRALRLLWDSNVAFDEWMHSVARYDWMHADDHEMIRRVMGGDT